MLKKAFLNRPLGFYIGLIGAAAALIGSVAYIVTVSGDKVFSLPAFLLILVGALCEILVIFTQFKAAPLLVSVFVSAGTGLFLYTAVPTITDILNGVVFIGGNQTAAVAFSAVFGVCSVVCAAASFLKERNIGEELAGR